MLLWQPYNVVSIIKSFNDYYTLYILHIDLKNETRTRLMTSNNNKYCIKSSKLCSYFRLYYVYTFLRYINNSMRIKYTFLWEYAWS